MRCNNNSGPTNSTDKVPGTAILSEGFEGDLSNYRQITYDPGIQGMMSISTQHAHSGKSSLTSDSNNTSIKRVISPSIDDSIAGLQFYLMATTAAHTNFFAAICKPGSSASSMTLPIPPSPISWIMTPFTQEPPRALWRRSRHSLYYATVSARWVHRATILTMSLFTRDNWRQCSVWKITLNGGTAER